MTIEVPSSDRKGPTPEEIDRGYDFAGVPIPQKYDGVVINREDDHLIAMQMIVNGELQGMVEIGETNEEVPREVFVPASQFGSEGAFDHYDRYAISPEVLQQAAELRQRLRSLGARAESSPETVVVSPEEIAVRQTIDMLRRDPLRDAAEVDDQTRMPAANALLDKYPGSRALKDLLYENPYLSEKELFQAVGDLKTKLDQGSPLDSAAYSTFKEKTSPHDSVYIEQLLKALELAGDTTSSNGQVMSPDVICQILDNYASTWDDGNHPAFTMVTRTNGLRDLVKEVAACWDEGGRMSPIRGKAAELYSAWQKSLPNSKKRVEINPYEK